MVMDTYKRVRFSGGVTRGGTNDYISVADHASLHFTNSMTFCFRFSSDNIDPSVYQMLLYKYSGLTGILIALSSATNTLTVYADGVARSFNGVMDYNQVTHLTVVYDIAGPTIKIYKNGVFMASNAYVALTSTVTTMYIGSNSGGAEFLKGYGYEAQCYNRVLTEAEIAYNFRHSNNPKRQGLVCSLVQTSIDKPAAGTWRDVSPQTGNNGTITNATTSKYPSIRSGANNIEFDGVDDYVNFGDITDFGANDFTISCWMKPPTTGAGWSGGINKGYSTGAPAHTWGIVRYGTSVSGIAYQDTINAGGAWNANLSMPLPGGWSHVVVRRVGTVYTIWRDGVLIGTQNVAAVDLTNADALMVGQWGGQFSHTKVNEIALYSRALSDLEIRYNFQHSNNPVRRGQIFRASAESLYGTTWKDISGGGMNGTINGSPRIRNINDFEGR